MSAADSSNKSSYLNYLPALFQDDVFLGQFLLAFEQILSSSVSSDQGQPSLETYIDQVHTYFQPYSAKNDTPVTPNEFLPWLANWVALSLRDDWDERTRRRFISKIVPLYQKRGTKAGLKELLELYVNVDKSAQESTVEIYEFATPVHYFQVTMSLLGRDNLAQKQAIARAILDQEKPAHTFYSLQILFPTMQIINTPIAEKKEEGLLLGINTLLGTTDK